MKSKSGGFLGLFKKKSTNTADSGVESDDQLNRTITSSNKTIELNGHLTDEMMPENRNNGSIARTSIVRCSPPGSIKVTSSTNSKHNSIDNLVLKRTNIELDGEENVLRTPVSLYDDSEIPQSPKEVKRKKRAAPPPPLPPPQPHQKRCERGDEKVGKITPIPPPHREKLENAENNYEEMLRNLQNKFEQWNTIRIQDQGSRKEEDMKHEVLKEHEKLKRLIENEFEKTSPVTPSPTTQQYTKKRAAPAKIPNFYKEKSSPPTTLSTKNVDENRNILIPTSKNTNSDAVDRLRKEVDEQRMREKEFKSHQTSKPLPSPSTVSPKVTPGPRLIEYKAMRKTQTTDFNESPTSPTPPPIPSTPPPKLAEYRRGERKVGYSTTADLGRKVVVNESPTTRRKSEYGILTTVERGRPAVIYEKSTTSTTKNQSPMVVRKSEYATGTQKNTVIGNGNATKVIRKSEYAKGNEVNILIKPDPPNPKTLNIPPNNPLKSGITLVTTSGNWSQKEKTSAYQTTHQTNGVKITEIKSNPPMRSPVVERRNLPTTQVPKSPVGSSTQREDDESKKVPKSKSTISKKPENTGEFLISDILKGAKLRKIGMPTEKSGISLGKVVDTPISASATQTPPPPPPPPPPPQPSQHQQSIQQSQSTPSKSVDLRDSLMHEIREAGRLRAIRTSQTA